jgi:DNA-binding PadR family transcriptional regulator
VPEAPLSLTATSYLVLGMVAHGQPCTSYDMKRLVGISIGMFWSFPHSQLYAEPARLTDAGLLSAERETSGRKRRLYRITPEGERALRDWLQQPAVDVGELRDLGVLKLFFAALLEAPDVASLANAQRLAHASELEKLERIRDQVSSIATPAQLATLELGLRWNRTAQDFWREVSENPPT